MEARKRSPKKHISSSLEDTEKVARLFACSLVPRKDGATVVCFSGHMGSGKTTFMQGVAKAFSIQAKVISPTYTLAKEYRVKSDTTPFTKLIHIDAYRLEDPSEAAVLSLEREMSSPETLICIEWGEKLADSITPHIYVECSGIDEHSKLFVW